MPYPELKAILTDIGTEELGHLEIVSAIVHQLTDNLSIEQIKNSSFAPYFTDHTVGVYPVAASGEAFSALTFQSTGDPITDLHENLAAEQKARTTYDNLLRMVDDGALGFKAAVSVSYLSKPTQDQLFAVISAEGIKPKLGQIAKLRSLDDCGSVTPDVMKNLLCAKPKPATRKVTLEIPAESVYAELADNTKEVQRLFLEFLKAYRQRAPCATDAQSPPQQIHV